MVTEVSIETKIVYTEQLLNAVLIIIVSIVIGVAGYIAEHFVRTKNKYIDTRKFLN